MRAIHQSLTSSPVSLCDRTDRAGECKHLRCGTFASRRMVLAALSSRNWTSLVVGAPLPRLTGRQLAAGAGGGPVRDSWQADARSCRRPLAAMRRTSKRPDLATIECAPAVCCASDIAPCIHVSLASEVRKDHPGGTVPSMDIYGINIRQPLAGDIVGEDIALAGLGTAFEASYVWKLVRGDQVLAEGFFQAGSMGAMQTWTTTLNIAGANTAGPAVLELAGDDPSEGEGGVVEPARVSVIVIPGSIGYVPYVVKKGDTLSAIVKEVGFGDPQVSTVKNTALASGIKNPDLIRPGQLIRVPV